MDLSVATQVGRSLSLRSVYRPLRPTKLDKIKNLYHYLHSDTLIGSLLENLSGDEERSIW